jgi:hypothetical protein
MAEMFQPINFSYSEYIPPTTPQELSDENRRVNMDLPDFRFEYRLNTEKKFGFWFTCRTLRTVEFRRRAQQYKDMVQTLVKRFVDSYVDAHQSIAAVRQSGREYHPAFDVVAENQLPTIIREVGDRPLDPFTVGPRRFIRIESQGVDHVRQLTREMRRRFEE